MLLFAGGVGGRSESERQLLGRLRIHKHFQLSVHFVRNDQRNASLTGRVSVNKNLVTGIEALETKRALAHPVLTLVWFVVIHGGTTLKLENCHEG